MRASILLASALLALTPFAATAQGKGNGGCPPGLAKKSPACVPPGLAKKGVTTREVVRDDDLARRDEDDDRWRVGDRLAAGTYIVLEPGDRVTLDGREYLVVRSGGDGVLLKREDDFYRLPGYDRGDYVRIGDSLIRVDPETRQIIELIQLADLILN